jgi:hypothetical protein
MPLMNYGVLVGRPVDRRTEGGTDTPHYQVHVRGGEVDFRVAVNCSLNNSRQSCCTWQTRRSLTRYWGPCPT